MKKIPRTVFWVLGALLALALLRDVLANGRPLYCRIGGVAHYPGLRALWASPERPFEQPALRSIQLQENQFEAWKNPANYDAPPLYAPIPFSPGEYSLRNPEEFKPPGHVQGGLGPRFRHWLGTDDRGRDVAAGLVAGARNALLVGTLSSVLAGLLGLGLGALAGFWGDGRLQATRGALLGAGLAALPGLYWAFGLRYPALSMARGMGPLLGSLSALLATVLLGALVGGILARRSSFFGKKVPMPADFLVMRAVEVFNATPKMIFILVLAAMLPGGAGFWVVVLLIGLFAWPDVAVLLRAELLRARELDYIVAAEGMGLSRARILWRHALPNALRPVLVVLAFVFAGAILMESALSFLHIGDGAQRGSTWGSLLEAVRARPGAWWVVLPPGLCIAAVVLALYQLGEQLGGK
jgi:peptide/nickel transport system permease protein